MELPPELIYETCEKMSISELKNFMQTSDRNYNICYNVFMKKETK